jgi:beta-N-acetylhexosaminidase
MIQSLSIEQRAWVERTLASMSLEEKIGHLLCPEDQGWSPEDWLRLIREVPLGSAFFKYDPPERCVECIDALQRESRIPMLIASDLEHGAGAMISGAINFPFPMALGAAGLTDLAYRMGRATAREGRAWGCHWTFSPVVDLNLNFQNPVTNIRSLGDRPEKVADLAAALIRGLQESGEMAATAKHFPGDGVDDRDQHICTSVNSLDMAAWSDTYGKVWKAAFDAGVLSVMVGHISLPAYEGLAEHPADALPATLSQKMQLDLLRKELGFEGLIVSDAVVMIGISSRVSREEKALRNILSGSDMVLFCDPRADHRRLMEAARDGRLPFERIDQSVRRVLELKARLNLHKEVLRVPLTPEETEEFYADARAVAEMSLTLLRKNEATPLKLHPGAHVLTVTAAYSQPGQPDPLAHVDEELRARGFKVEHLSEMNGGFLREHAHEFDAVFVNVVIYPHARMGTVRLTGDLIKIFWESFWPDCPQAVFTAFGSPYLLYELPHLPNLYTTYSHSPLSQEAAVRGWLGEIEPRGRPPVRMPDVF